MLRVSPYFLRGRGNERVTMGNAAVAEELAGSEELDELYRLDATESEPEDDEEDYEDDEDGEDGEDGGGIQPEEIPHP